MSERVGEQSGEINARPGRWAGLGVFAAGVAAALLAGLGARAYINYQAILQKARQRVSSGGRVIKTAMGPVEVAEAGAGDLTILAVHGAGGGYDQGLFLGRTFLGQGFRVIAPSRFGYLRSPALGDGSLADQAAAFAALLDALEVEQVVVAAVSAGGPPALQFALDYPERTKALIMVSGISYAEPNTAEAGRTEAMINRVVGSDLVYWLATRLFRPQLLQLFGVPAPVQARLTASEKAQLSEILDIMLPMSRRLPGIAIDQAQVPPEGAQLAQITAPTLVFHARDDNLIDFSHGRHTADHLPNATFVSLPDGGHFLMGHQDQVAAKVLAFLGDLA